MRDHPDEPLLDLADANVREMLERDDRRRLDGREWRWMLMAGAGFVLLGLPLSLALGPEELERWRRVERDLMHTDLIGVGVFGGAVLGARRLAHRTFRPRWKTLLESSRGD